jgi:hypothetical protein
VLNWTKAVPFVVIPSLIAAGVAACFVVPSLLPKSAPKVPDGFLYITLSNGCIRMSSTELSPHDPSQACTLAGVNHSGKSVESVLLQISTKTKLTLAGDTSGFGSMDGEIRVSKPLLPGEQAEYLALPAPGTIEWIAVGRGKDATKHAVKVPLVAGTKLVISYEPDGKLFIRMR